MKGAGPNYGKEDIELKDGDYHPMPLEGGTVQIDTKRQKAKISLTMKQDSGAKPFIGNGDYKIHKSG